MDTVHDPYVSDRPDGPRVTPLFTERLEQAAARLGLPPAA